MKELTFEEMLMINGGRRGDHGAEGRDERGSGSRGGSRHERDDISRHLGSRDYRHPGASKRGLSSGHEAYKYSNSYERPETSRGGGISTRP